MSAFVLQRPIIWMTALGAVSGVFSHFSVSAFERIAIWDVPAVPGLIFGLAIGFGLYRWGAAKASGAVIALISTMIAWTVAVRIFRLVTEGAGVGPTSMRYYWGGLIAGAIGAAITAFGGAIGAEPLRKVSACLLIAGVGALAGLLVVPVAQGGERYMLLLFVVWQSAVAASMAMTLRNR